MKRRIAATLGLLGILAVSSGCGTTDHDGVPPVEGVFPGTVQVQPLNPGGAESQEVVYELKDAADKTLGYAVELRVTARSGPFPILVVLDANRCVQEVRVLQYTASRGRGVLARHFATQFKGKCPADPIRVGADIDAVTGATLSARAVAGGVRQAMQRVAALVNKPGGTR